MDLGIRGKLALVTGASRGIGRAIAVGLAREKVRVVGVSRSESDLQDLLTEMEEQGSGHRVVSCDLSRSGGPEELMRDAMSPNMPDILVNNVGGTLGVVDPLCGSSDWLRVLRFNLEVPVELARLAIPYMRRQKWGRIVNISSISGLEQHGPIPYCASKAALIAYTRGMGRFVSPDNVIMSTVASGAVYTEGGYWDVASLERPEHVEAYTKERMAIQRLGRPEEIADVVAFLCSDRSSFCVGSVVPVDGGQGRSYST